METEPQEFSIANDNEEVNNTINVIKNTNNKHILFYIIIVIITLIVLFIINTILNKFSIFYIFI